MGDFHPFNDTGGQVPGDPREEKQNDIYTQLAISVALGVSAFIFFCFLRPRWNGLFAARKRKRDAASMLPELPDSFFGWIPVLYRITEQEVLASAGLDAFVFLAFFRMAIKFLSITFLLALVVIAPVHYKFLDSTDATLSSLSAYVNPVWLHDHQFIRSKPQKERGPTGYLWMYVVFVWSFTGLVVYLLLTETERIIRVRQNYLGRQSTITDRTIRLSGVPEGLRSDAKIKEHIEALEIGKVESVTLCRNWKELDRLMDQRAATLRKLEEALTVYLGKRRVERNLESLPVVQPPPPEPTPAQETEDEGGHLLDHNDGGHSRGSPYARDRPTIKLRHGFLKLRSTKVDAIDRFQQELKKQDEKIKALRTKEFEPTALAFVTMDSVASCQMAVQAILDPSPFRLRARHAPAPTDVIWPNTYLPRSRRMLLAWSITAVIVLLTLFWVVPIAALTPLLKLESIRKIWPQLAAALDKSDLSRSLVNTVLPTVVVSLLNTAVPYLYDWLSNYQGMISQGEVELSVISKNFFFTFFNLFVVWTITSAATNYYSLLKESLKDTTLIATLLAKYLGTLTQFYTNLIVLQGIGLFPLRLLMFGSVALYPITLMGAKTPRDYAELAESPFFQYGFYLPQTIFIFLLCIIYSVLPGGSILLFFGLIYFCIGHFTYKYQLLYAMDHTQHSTGRAWPMICYRIMLGLVVFQLGMAGVLAGQSAFTRAGLVVPLIPGTIWLSYYYARTYEPLVRYIALGSIHLKEQEEVFDGDEQGESRRERGTDRGRTIDETREKDLKYVNPSLVAPLGDVWINDEEGLIRNNSANGNGESIV